MPAGGGPVGVTVSGRGASTLTLSAFVAEAPAVSVTVTVKLKVPFVVGVPESSVNEFVLLEGPSTKPGGTPVPVVQVTAPVPPVVLTVAR